MGTRRGQVSAVKRDGGTGTVPSQQQLEVQLSLPAWWYHNWSHLVCPNAGQDTVLSLMDDLKRTNR